MKILVCDDHALFREGLRLVLNQVDADAEIFEASEGEEALAIVAENDDIDLLLLDLNMPGMDGWISLRRLRSRYPEIPVVIVSATETAGDVKTALDSGASGFIPKSSGSAELMDALRRILDGEIYVPPQVEAISMPTQERTDPSLHLESLSGRERDVLALLSLGKTSGEIAETLGLPENEVSSRIASALSSLDFKAATK